MPSPRALLPIALASLLAACQDRPGTTAPAEPPMTAAASEKDRGERGAEVDAVPGAAAPASAPQAPDAATAPQVLEGIPRQIPRPGPEVRTAPIASGAEVTYACESGAQLRVRYAGSVAEVAWTGGAWLVLSRTAPADAGGETYAGEGHVLLRLGNVVELRGEPGSPVIRCAEAAANA